MQVVLGLFWLLDAALQYQPYMFTDSFVRQTIRPALAGDPTPISTLGMWTAGVMAQHIVIYNAIFATIQPMQFPRVRRHPAGHKTGPTGPLTDRRPKHCRGAHRRWREAQHWRFGARPERPGRAAAVQRPRDDRIIESDLIKMRTREGMQVAKAKGRLRGKPPKLKAAQEAHLVELWRAGKHTSAELAELFSVARSTVYRAVRRARQPTDVRARGA